MTTDTAILDRVSDDTGPILRALIPTRLPARDRPQPRPVREPTCSHPVRYWAVFGASITLGAVLGLVAGITGCSLVIAVASGTGAL